MRTNTDMPAALHYAEVLENYYFGIGRIDATGAATALRELHAALLELVEQEYPASSWNAEHIDYEISMGNGAAPLVKRVRELVGAQSAPQPADPSAPTS